MGVGDFFSGAWDSVTDAYDGFKAGLSDWDAYANVEKALERQLVHTFFAPSKIDQRNKIKTQFDEKVQTIASDAQTGLTTIANGLDTTIKGDFSKAIQQTIKEKNDKWDDV